MTTLPQQIGRFRIEGLLGRGAMGVVYKAHDPHIDRAVAIKLVRADLLDGGTRSHYLSRFRNEARMSGRCIHRNIVGIHDFSEHEGNPFLVLEYVDGQDLGRAVPRGTQVSLPQVSSIALETLAALGHAHGLGVIHRDVKPANILLAKDGTLKVTDFGISRAVSAEATMGSMLVGTPCYMSPEQCVGAELDERSDLFSLGCVLYELLSGRRAFGAANYVATMHALIHDTPPALDMLRAGTPAALVQVVERAIAKKPADRFRNAAEMAAAVRAAMNAPLATAGDDADTLVVRQEAEAEQPGSSDPGSRSRPASTAIAAGNVPAAAADDARTNTADASAPSASLQQIERRLAHHVGPMARYHLRRALTTAASIDELCGQLADTLPDTLLRPRFIAEITELLSQDPALPPSLRGSARPAAAVAAAPAAALDDDTIERVRQAMARIVGPVASRLVNRVLPRAEDLPTLLQACAEMIDRPQDRQRFAACFDEPVPSRGNG